LSTTESFTLAGPAGRIAGRLELPPNGASAPRFVSKPLR